MLHLTCRARCAVIQDLVNSEKKGSVNIDAQHLINFSSGGANLCVRCDVVASACHFRLGESFLQFACRLYFSALPCRYKQFVRYPQDLLPVFDLVLNEELDIATKQAAQRAAGRGSSHTVAPPAGPALTLRSRFFNLPVSENVSSSSAADVNTRPPSGRLLMLMSACPLVLQRRMRDLNPADVDTLVSIKGMVIRASALIPNLRRAYFGCERCGLGVEVRCGTDRGPLSYLSSLYQYDRHVCADYYIQRAGRRRSRSGRRAVYLWRVWREAHNVSC